MLSNDSSWQNYMTFSLSAAGLLIDAIGAGLIFFNSPEVSFGTYMYTKAEHKELDKKAAAIRFRARTDSVMPGMSIENVYFHSKFE